MLHPKLDGISCGLAGGVNAGSLLGGEAAEDIVRGVDRGSRTTDSNPQAGYLSRSQLVNDVLQPLLPPRCTGRSQAQLARREIEVVTDDENVSCGDFVKDKMRLDRPPAEVHISGRSQEKYTLIAEPAISDVGLELTLPTVDVQPLGEDLQHVETDVVPSPRVLATGIAKTNNQLHGEGSSRWLMADGVCEPCQVSGERSCFATAIETSELRCQTDEAKAEADDEAHREHRAMPSRPRTVELTLTTIDHSAVVEAVRSHLAGAVVLFLGTVRELTAGKRTESLDYEAYPEMAVQQIHQLLDQADARWPVIRSAVVHRVGHLELGDIAVAVAVSTPHRKDAFEAGQWVMDRIKEVVPIWKKEHWADGSTEWVHPDSGRPGATDDGAAG